MTWSDVRAALDVVGCRSNTAIDDAIARARTRGVEPSEALAIVEHAQRCVIGDVAAWGAGAVLHRLAQQRPGDEIGDYWPAPDPAFVAREANERRRHFEEADRAAKARQDAEDARRGEELRQTAVDRERRYGPILDAMDDTQRAALWHSFYPLPFRRAQRLRADLLRQQLLLLVARRFESVDPAEEPGWSGSVDSVCELPSPLSGASR